MKGIAFLILFSSGFLVLVLGYPGPWTLVVGGVLLLASYGIGYSGLTGSPSRETGLGVKGPGETVEKVPVKPSIGLELKRRLEEE